MGPLPAQGLTGGAPHNGQRYVTEVAYYAHLLGEAKQDDEPRAVQRMSAPEQEVFVAWARQFAGVGRG
nr:hypothetical protein GCM10020093_003270 [Planobispora longispora]